MRKIVLALLLMPLVSNAAVYKCSGEFLRASVNNDGTVNFSSAKPIPEQPALPLQVSFTPDVITIFNMGNIVATSNFVFLDNKSLSSLIKNNDGVAGKMALDEVSGSWQVAGFFNGDEFYVSDSPGSVALATHCETVN